MSAAVGRIQPGWRSSLLAFSCVGLLALGAGLSEGGEVSGVVRMPEICSTSVCPELVYLTQRAAGGTDSRAHFSGSERAATEKRVAELALVKQRGLQFVPRVQAIEIGQSIRFTNQDGETHNVHVVSPHFMLNQSMSPGQPLDFTPDHAGVMKLVCDIHHHMRGFVVVSPSPWFRVCDRDGRFRLAEVPAGHYVLNVWHEMGDPLRTEVDAVDGKSVNVPPLVLSLPAGLVGGGNGKVNTSEAPVRPWSEVVDRIGVMLAEGRDTATHRGEPAKARRLVDDAYWGEFETSEMETAIRKYVGFARAGDIERGFREIATAVRKVGAKRESTSELVERCDRLIALLVEAAKVLDSKGVIDRSKIDAIDGVAVELDANVATPAGEPRLLLHALQRGFRRVGQAAQQDGPLEAAAELELGLYDGFRASRALFARSPAASGSATRNRIQSAARRCFGGALG